MQFVSHPNSVHFVLHIINAVCNCLCINHLVFCSEELICGSLTFVSQMNNEIGNKGVG